ncbi:fibrinogen C domain-containing protein 1-A-like [Physella acuta]|uniref:fibrinogen C domain-containing protein 1-A-like n=1 Tax=Physella acuta TaxID=109671 RepID=UPI0027DE0CC5|nr:fibrinogen C domain-containing protein 1-A-like [Physella acuta]
MTVGPYTGNSSDRFGYASGIGFTTIDRDNDVDHNNNNCADYYHGGWWYKGCHSMNINGQWGNTRYGEGLTWYPLTSFYQSVSTVEMKVRKPDTS